MDSDLKYIFFKFDFSKLVYYLFTSLLVVYSETTIIIILVSQAVTADTYFLNIPLDIYYFRYSPYYEAKLSFWIYYAYPYIHKSKKIFPSAVCLPALKRFALLLPRSPWAAAREPERSSIGASASGPPFGFQSIATLLLNRERSACVFRSVSIAVSQRRPTISGINIYNMWQHTAKGAGKSAQITR